MRPHPPVQRSSRRADWSRALEHVVHAGMVVGILSFVLVDLATLPGAGVVSVGTAVTGLVSAGLVLAMRRTPLVGLLIVGFISLAVSAAVATLGLRSAGAAAIGFGEVAAVCVLASMVARRGSPRAVVGGVATAISVTAANAALRAPDVLGIVAFFWLVLTIAVAMGFALRWTERSRQMSEDAARREERLSIARELHDSVAHHVTGIVVQAQAARAVGRSNPEAVEGALVSIEQSGLATMTAMRRLVGALRGDDDPLAPTAGLDDLPALVEDSGDAYEIALDIDADGVPTSVGPSIYRIVQESLTNVRRHGVDVTKVEVTVRTQDDGVQVSVVDDGRHDGHPPAHGFGLAGMSERVGALGGQFWAGVRPGRGWAVTAWIPSGR